MKILKAETEHIDIVRNITHTTIETVYPHYYPEGAVRFFLEHHNKTNIMTDIECGYVYIFENDNSDIVGTVTVKGNELNRLFILPYFQGMGFGSVLLDFSEEMIFKDYDEIIISASLPAKRIYLKRNYIETAYNMISTKNGDFLCYDEMKKYRNKKDY